MSGKWTALDASIGAGIDSYFEYLVKGAILFQYPDLMQMFQGEVSTSFLAHSWNGSIAQFISKCWESQATDVAD